ncbi:hypothetical protein R1sor_024958 [Riccia sorocarpa]|uniref:Reverse transcriptase zinc-binding domain-containing protein n=1 Tax=Riccia sorocarpa TaxID=122646 RepID=A0ABD3GAG1_9MARC
MSSGRELKSALASVMPGATVIQDSREDGTADTVMLIHKKIRVKAQGSSGTGHLAWAIIATAVQESISTLKTDTGEMVTEEASILKLIEDTELYRVEPENRETKVLRRQVLQLVDKKLTDQQNRKLEEQPLAELIEDIVRSLPKEKSPGLDRVTAELLVASWGSMREDCFRMLSKVAGSRTLTRMMTAWKQVRLKLEWQDSCKEVLGHLTMEQGIQLMQWGNKDEITRFQKCTGLLRKAGIYTLLEGAEANRNNSSWREAMATARIFSEEEEMAKIQRMETWLKSKTLVNMELHEVDGWRWSDDDKKINWRGSTKEWANKIGGTKEYSEYLNEKWGRTDTKQVWEKRWTRLWQAAIHHRRKSWIWRFIQRGYFTGSRGKGWDEALKKCSWCEHMNATLEHAFWTCRSLSNRLEEMSACGGMPPGCNSQLSWLDAALERAKEDTSYLWLFGSYLAITWSERNDLRFNGRRNHRPLRALLRLTALEIEAFPSRSMGDRICEVSVS